MLILGVRKSYWVSKVIMDNPCGGDLSSSRLLFYFFFACLFIYHLFLLCVLCLALSFFYYVLSKKIGSIGNYIRRFINVGLYIGMV